MKKPDDEIVITKKQAKRLVRLIERWTRCEILGRYSSFTNHVVKQSLLNVDFTQKRLDYEDKIRICLFGTADTVKLGEDWGLLTVEELKETKARHKKLDAKTKQKRSERAMPLFKKMD